MSLETFLVARQIGNGAGNSTFIEGARGIAFFFSFGR
jgi:hypothetical protein